MTHDTAKPAVGDPTKDTKSRSPGRPTGSVKQAKAGHRIKLPDGDELQPVDDIAADLLVSSRTVRRKAATVLVGGVSYARVSAIPQILADATTPKRRGRR
jgi:hypothetical protein